MQDRPRILFPCFEERGEERCHENRNGVEVVGERRLASSRVASSCASPMVASAAQGGAKGTMQHGRLFEAGG